MEQRKPLVKLVDIKKEFPGVKALKGVSLEILPGEVHGLVGENGAGKSTLIKIMMGAYTATSGEIFVDGVRQDIRNPQQARALGLGAVYQDVTLAPHLTVAENFFLGCQPRKSGRVDWKTMYRSVQKTLDELNIRVNAKARINELTIGQQEMVTIAKVVYQNAKVIVFDEPTALLANEEVQLLFRMIGQLREKGYGIVYISHRMEEIFQLCDRVTVIKDGTYVDTVKTSEVDEDKLVQMMVGRDVEDLYNLPRPDMGECVLEVNGLTRKGIFEDISFSVHRGEIFGMFGLVGAGRTEVCRAIFGADPYEAGTVTVLGKSVHHRHPMEAIENSIAFLTEDRKKEGLCLGLSVEKNVSLASYPMISRSGIINLKKERQRAEEYRHALAIKTPSVQQLCKNLSGGNQQKVVIAKWLCRDSDVFIFDEPTVGVDVGAKVEIYRLMGELLQQGKAIILVSSYLPEVMGLSDRMLVMSEGKSMGIVEKDQYYTEDGRLNEEYILRKASNL